MSLALVTVNNSAIEDLRLKWIPCSDITDIDPTPTDAIYYASRKQPDGKVKETMLALLGSSEECTPTLVNEFARTYSLPTHKYNDNDSRFRRYSKWLEECNKLIMGFTKLDDNYYMVAYRRFYHCYSRYGFCTACGILRCSPVWCICGHKQLSDEWTSNNNQLDEFIKKSQLLTNSPNDAYLEWIPFDYLNVQKHDVYLRGLPNFVHVKLIPLEVTNKTDDSYYDKVNYSIINYA